MITFLCTTFASFCLLEIAAAADGVCLVCFVLSGDAAAGVGAGVVGLLGVEVAEESILSVS